MYEAIATSRIYQQIVEQIERSIRDGQLRAGDQLPPERELAQRFGVSRTAVREAVKALGEKGLIQSQHGRGTFVTDGSEHAIRNSLDRIVTVGGARPDGTAHLIAVRQMLEPEIAARAAVSANQKD